MENLHPRTNSINTVILVGRAGRNPEIKYFESGKTLATFSLAVDRPKSSPDGESQTDWFKIELWGRQAEIAYEYVKKGSLVGIRGRIEFRLPPEGGTPEMVIHNISLRLLGSKHDLAPPKSEDLPF
ncbi:single-stranded DNA-binding protein [bacterium (Candidatus Blackallbacteria) CG17_big_fil_post_rev_8_21_14_2_50_48_46]|uniref:Single-stranded DNA-binding protein n=1 Tax=bacterium (Candidatus Blackallbacteria) CG17_big_fil_post_rev_8_21_14_2_50_48_46 TaxID=2014261 RepID=A0A2M7GA63_9BACT|nr:MAG: single-stranded DNA-binding protein [bacterium (Candidatus Blackallbacteria) CG18_big_fil_WC_8_21_14_2_50_49_26]PIW19031.1 MAG: single-stranded DNA-binding protein [bacterium (Candidatus Blackallbacteria) CG17_big_fil_post_rev_8_21_14_2_50_48_46]PIW44601.1 MAG: single-stranded DNA-binding protein [bacterium (Candidatus Blackallbacteria) CG13_big_fil_rev_8_21_14_2_50_49_14]